MRTRKPRIERYIARELVTTHRPVQGTGFVMCDITVNDTERVTLDHFHPWKDLPNSKFSRELLHSLYPVAKQTGIAPSKRKRDHWHNFKASIDIMFYQLEQHQNKEAQALAQAS